MGSLLPLDCGHYEKISNVHFLNRYILAMGSWSRLKRGGLSPRSRKWLVSSPGLLLGFLLLVFVNLQIAVLQQHHHQTSTTTAGNDLTTTPQHRSSSSEANGIDAKALQRHVSRGKIQKRRQFIPHKNNENNAVRLLHQHNRELLLSRFKSEGSLHHIKHKSNRVLMKQKALHAIEPDSTEEEATTTVDAHAQRQHHPQDNAATTTATEEAAVSRDESTEQDGGGGGGEQQEHDAHQARSHETTSNGFHGMSNKQRFLSQLKSNSGLVTASTGTSSAGGGNDKKNSRLQLLDRLVTSAANMENFEAQKRKGTNHFSAHDNRLEETKVEPTPEDPDGLLQRLESRWSAVKCHETVMPPKLNPTAIANPNNNNKDNNTPLLGVLVDAARNYFPLKWLYGLVDFLSVLGYGLIHFRLTDDQSFVVRLESRPELAVSAVPDQPDQVYSAQELRDWVGYAAQKGIDVMPEVNVPGHAGGWHRIPGMILPCPQFICGLGYGIPMDVSNPLVLNVLADVIREVRDIFSSPYLHLGGDEVHMSQPCLEELQVDGHFQTFEDALQTTLEQQGIPLDKVIRWETTSGAAAGGGFDAINKMMKKHRAAHGKADLVRAGQMLHYWYQRPTDYSATTTGANQPLPKDFFISTDLYFDTCHDREAWDIYQFTVGHVALQPVGIVAATFELGPCSWEDRNVWGKLLAVAMGATATRTSPAVSAEKHNAFVKDYAHKCAAVGLPDHICNLKGGPKIATEDWKDSHTTLQLAWIATACHRLTNAKAVTSLKKLDRDAHKDPGLYEQSAIALAESTRKKLESKVKKKKNKAVSVVPAENALYQHSYNYTGVMVDLANDHFSRKRLHDTIDVMAKLGFNLLHLRLLDKEHFPVNWLDYPEYKLHTGQYYEMEDFVDIVQYAAKRGIAVVPEINYLGNGGGWANSGLLIDCPRVICDEGGPLGLDLRKPRSLLILVTLVGSLLETFTTAPFLHMGTSNRQDVAKCYKEAYPLSKNRLDRDVDSFEGMMNDLVELMGLGKDQIMRWAAPEKPSTMFGSVLHYPTLPTKQQQQQDVTDPYFASKPFDMDSLASSSAWDIYRQSREQQQHRSAALGMIVTTIDMTRSMWDSANVLARLIPVAAAVSTLDTMNESEFDANFQSTCQRLETETSSRSLCEGKGAAAAEEHFERMPQNHPKGDEEEEELCDRFTRTVVDRVPREDVFHGGGNPEL